MKRSIRCDTPKNGVTGATAHVDFALISLAFQRLSVSFLWVFEKKLSHRDWQQVTFTLQKKLCLGDSLTLPGPLCKTCKTCKTPSPWGELHESHELHGLGCHFSFLRLGEYPRDVSAGFGLGIPARQFAFRFHLFKQGVGFIRAAHNPRPINITCPDALGIVRQ